jgi:hypothetical protein
VSDDMFERAFSTAEERLGKVPSNLRLDASTKADARKSCKSATRLRHLEAPLEPDGLKQETARSQNPS